MEDSEPEECKILELPECVLTLLLSYLDTTSLYQLTRTCRLLKSIIEVPRFWKYIDARNEPNTNDKVQYCTDRIHQKTTHVFFKAKDRHCGRVPSNFFLSIRPYTNLKVLVLENQRFSGSKLSLKDFPTSLEELSLKKTNIKNAEYFFSQSDKTMRNLRVLSDGCKWVTSSFFMSTAKYENLEIVSAIKCLRIHLDMVPYLSVARIHCRKLKVFDCRFTGIGHELLRTFYSKEEIQSLYFQSLKSSELDYDKKIFNNSYMRALTYPTEVGRLDNIICDESLLEYINCIGAKCIEPISDSFLYKDPYPKCTCNYKERDHKAKLPESNVNEEYYLCESPRQQLMKFVCQKHLTDVQRLPKEFKEFFVSNQREFYADSSSDVDSDSESSGSESDNSCCMYGMGRKMILLTPGSNHELNQEVLELNREERRDRPNFNIFIANLFDQNRNPTHEVDRAIPSTSRSVIENSTNENIENTRNEAKRRHSGDAQTQRDDDDAPAKPKKRKLDNAGSLDPIMDEMYAAEVDALVESTAEVRNRLNNVIQTGLDTINRPARSSANQDGPSTSRASDNSGALHVHVVCKSSASVPSNETPQDLRQDEAPEVRNPANAGNSDRMRRLQIFCERSRPMGMVSRIVVRHDHINVAHERKKKLSLHRLSLRGFKRITDIALEYIKNLNIDLLDLTYTSVTEDGIERFLLENPNCRIIHPLYCVCKPINPFE